MPTTTVTEITGWAHCNQARCPGNQQQEVQILKQNDSFTYVERGGDLPGEEASFVYYSFASEEQDLHCPHCGEPRSISPTPRRKYANLSGHNPMGLLDVEPFDAGKQPAPADAELRAENADLKERLARLEGYVMGQQAPEPVVEEPEIEVPVYEHEEQEEPEA